MPKKTDSDPKNSRFRSRIRRTIAGADWGMLPAETLRRAIAVVTLHGGALRFGYTRDGGAYALGIYGLGEPTTEYIRPSEDVEGVLTEVEQAFEELPLPEYMQALDHGQGVKPTSD